MTMLLIALIASIVFLSILFFVKYSNESWGDGVSSLYFGHSINLSNNTGVSESAITVLSGNNVYVVWQDNSTGNGDIYFRRSIDGGHIFDDILNISNNSGSSQTPQIAVSGNNVYVVWQDNSTGNGDIYLKGSFNNGENFTKRRNISDDPGSSQLPQIAVSENNTKVIWINSNGTSSSVFSKSGNMTQLRGLQKFASGTDTESLKLKASDENVFAVWTSDLGNRQVIMFNHFSFSRQDPEELVLSNVNGSSSSPSISTFGPNTFVVWQDNSTGSSDVYVKKISSTFFERDIKK
ncbi:MAG TPA: hypothetical protein VJS91_08310 [Nitrososphaeraceae archaeon]|nr:hypothetical protein [Nitrososphaeraceae archaeon]